MEIFATPEAWISLLTLTSLEIVLGIDNIVFITILTSRLPKEKQLPVRRIGLAAAFISRVALLGCLSWIIKLDEPVFTAMGYPLSVKDLVLVGGGLFLLVKSTLEIYKKVEAVDESHGSSQGSSAVMMIIAQIMLVDVIFSLDSVITAVGLAKHLPVMVLAVLIAIVVMMIFARAIGQFIDENPSITILALSFLIMIGVLLVAEGFGEHLNKGYVYFGMIFALGIEMLNRRYHKNRRSRASAH